MRKIFASALYELAGDGDILMYGSMYVLAQVF